MPVKKLNQHALSGELNADESEFINPGKLAAKLNGLSPTTLYRWAAAGKMPKPIAFPDGKKMWRISDIECWIKSLPNG